MKDTSLKNHNEKITVKGKSKILRKKRFLLYIPIKLTIKQASFHFIEKKQKTSTCKIIHQLIKVQTSKILILKISGTVCILLISDSRFQTPSFSEEVANPSIVLTIQVINDPLFLTK